MLKNFFVNLNTRADDICPVTTFRVVLGSIILIAFLVACVLIPS